MRFQKAVDPFCATGPKSSDNHQIRRCGRVCLLLGVHAFVMLSQAGTVVNAEGIQLFANISRLGVDEAPGNAGSSSAHPESDSAEPPGAAQHGPPPRNLIPSLFVTLHQQKIICGMRTKKAQTSKEDRNLRTSCFDMGLQSDLCCSRRGGHSTRPPGLNPNLPHNSPSSTGVRATRAASELV